MRIDKLLRVWIMRAEDEMQQEPAAAGEEAPLTEPPPRRRLTVHIQYEKAICKTTAALSTPTIASSASASSLSSRVNPCSPAYALLRTLDSRATKSSPPPPQATAAAAAAAVVVAVVDTIPYCWTAKSVSRIMRWLQGRGFKYTYSDWEAECHTDDARCWKPQHGIARGYGVSASAFPYVCTLCPQPAALQMHVQVERRSALTPNATRRVLMRSLDSLQYRQRRIYLHADAGMSVHIVGGDDAERFRIWVDIAQESTTDPATVSLLTGFSDLADSLLNSSSKRPK